MNKDDIFWDIEDAESLRNTDLNEAVYAQLDDMALPFPKTITLFKWKRQEPPKATMYNAKNLIIDIKERLDEDYGDQIDGECSYEYPEEAEEMALEFLKKIYDMYVPWTCELTGEKEVINVKEWVKKHSPHWMKDGKVTFVEDIL